MPASRSRRWPAPASGIDRRRGAAARRRIPARVLSAPAASRRHQLRRAPPASCRSPIGARPRPAHDLALGVDRQCWSAGRAHAKAWIGRAFRVEVDPQLVEAQLGDERRRPPRPRRDPRTPPAPSAPARALLASGSSDGISLRQGWHHVAHKLRITSLPLKSASATGLPSSSVKRVSGAGCGERAGINSPSLISGSLDIVPRRAKVEATSIEMRHDNAAAFHTAPSRRGGDTRDPADTTSGQQHRAGGGQSAVGRPLCRRSGRDHAPHQCLDRFRQAPLCRGYRRLAGALRDARRATHPLGRRWRGDRRGSRANPRRDRERRLCLQRGRTKTSTSTSRRGSPS